MSAAQTYLAQMHARASTLADRAVEARALAVASTAALLRAEYRECFDLSARGLELNIATGDREAEAMTRGRMAVTAAWLADFDTSLREFDLALQTYESIGHKRGIALTYTNRTVLLMRLGMFAEALRSIERSNDYFETVHEQRTIVANHVNASFVHTQLGDAHTAKALAESALGAAREIGFPLFEAAALANVGNAERLLGNAPAAIDHMTAGIALRRPLQEARDFVDDLADLTLAYVAAGRAAEARATACELAAIGVVSFDGAVWPQSVWWAIAQGRDAGGDRTGAAAAVDRAKSELARFAGRIRDATARDAFLAIPVNVRIAGG
jgi:tetratricopeptide (TPR) repeat protein